MKRIFSLLILLSLPGMILFSQSTASLAGIWENRSRFVEFSADNRMRIVLKPYYGFVYQDNGWIPCARTELQLDSPPSDSVQASLLQPDSPAADLSVPGAFLLTLRYKGEKKDATVPVALVNDALYFRFYRKAVLPANSAGAALAAVSSGVSGSAPSAVAAGTAALDATVQAAKPGALDGFWISAGNAGALRLYRNEPVSEFFCYYFSGNSYYRIRYWADDVRYRDISAQFTAQDGTVLSVPKFIYIKGTLYTCITTTGTILRNYETGTFSAASGSLSFKPQKIVFSGTAGAIMKPLPFCLSPDGTLLALGSPYLVRSKVTDLAAEIKAHNALRRPPRKPVLELMKLNFYWDEIDRIRNNGRSQTK